MAVSERCYKINFNLLANTRLGCHYYIMAIPGTRIHTWHEQLCSARIPEKKGNTRNAVYDQSKRNKNIARHFSFSFSLLLRWPSKLFYLLGLVVVVVGYGYPCRLSVLKVTIITNWHTNEYNFIMYVCIRYPWEF